MSYEYLISAWLLGTLQHYWEWHKRATHPKLTNPITFHTASVTALCPSIFLSAEFRSIGCAAPKQLLLLCDFHWNAQKPENVKPTSCLFINIQCVRSLVSALTLAKSKLMINCLHWMTVFCCMHLSICDIIQVDVIRLAVFCSVCLVGNCCCLQRFFLPPRTPWRNENIY